MAKVTIPVGFDNHPELYEYVVSKGNKGEFIRNCISKEMYQEKLIVGDDTDLDAKIERIMKKCLQEYNPVLNNKPEIKNVSNELQAAANFFDED